MADEFDYGGEDSFWYDDDDYLYVEDEFALAVGAALCLGSMQPSVTQAASYP